MYAELSLVGGVYGNDFIYGSFRDHMFSFRVCIQT